MERVVVASSTQWNPEGREEGLRIYKDGPPADPYTHDSAKLQPRTPRAP